MNDLMTNSLRFQAGLAVERKLREAAQFGSIMSEHMEAKADGLIQISDEEFEEYINNQRKLR